MKVAIIHEWLEQYAGSERVLECLFKLFPQADLFAIVDFVAREQRAFLGGRPVKTSFIQRLPFARRRFRNYLGLMPFAIEQFDLAGYDTTGRAPGGGVGAVGKSPAEATGESLA